MTVKEAFKRIGSAFAKVGKSIYKFIANAKLKDLLRIGLVAGISISSVILFFRYLKHKKDIYTNEDNKSVVDRALQINYADVRNQKELNPLMKKVKKNLHKEIKPRMKKDLKRKVNKHKTEYEKFLQDMDYQKKKTDRFLNDYRDREGRELFEDLDRFIEEMRLEDEFNRNWEQHSTTRIKNIWDNC